MSMKALIDEVAPQFDTRAQAERAVRAVFNGVANQVAAGHSVSIRDFGTFKRQTRNQRTGRNPKTGEAITIQARDVMTFKASGNIC